jgi:hypothetical protein
MKPQSTESSRLLFREPELGRISRRDRRAFAPERERRCIAVRLFSKAVAGAQVTHAAVQKRRAGELR